VFVHGKLLQPSLIFVGKAGAYITDSLNKEARVFVLGKPFQHRLIFLLRVRASETFFGPKGKARAFLTDTPDK